MVPKERPQHRPQDLWARSGAMALTGHAEGPPLPAPGALAACAEAALAELRALAPQAPLPRDGAALLGEHAACFGYTRRGRTSPGGSCRLLPCADGWIALNLARADDVASLPAWLECDAGAGLEAGLEAWKLAERGVARRPAKELLERARLLSLPVAISGPPPEVAPAWLHDDAHGEPSPPADGHAPLVVDLSSLWAGPLCTSLLRDLGARVVKVESTRRPDGARANPRFFDLMNGGKASVALDFTRNETEGRAALASLIDHADIVVEATRPRALRQLGIEAEPWLAARPGRTWLSITGYGRRDPEPARVAFGDDAAVAAGLAFAQGRVAGERVAGEPDGAPLFCSDAIADPLTGLHAARATWRSWCAGGGRLLDVSLSAVAGHALAFAADDAEAGSQHEPARPPRARPARQRASALGADTASVFRELGIPC